MTSPLTSKAVVCTLKISNWLGNKTDSKITGELAEEKHADQKRIKVVKKLVDPDILSDMSALIQRARMYRKQKTVCWGDGGERVLPVRKLDEYREEMTKFKDEFQELRQKIVDKLPQAKEDARRKILGLGETWNESDYPSQEQLMNKFGFYSRILPISNNTGDIRLEGYSDSAMAEIQREMQEAKNNQVSVAINDCKSRLKEYLGGYAEKLRNNKRLHDTLSENLKDLLDLLESFSFLDNELSQQINEARKLIVDVDLFRKNDVLKTDKIKEAENILKTFS